MTKRATRVGARLKGVSRTQIATEEVARRWERSGDVLKQLIAEEVLVVLSEYGDDPDWITWGPSGEGLGDVSHMVETTVKRGLQDYITSFEREVIKDV